jgi:hypothetical protein
LTVTAISEKPAAMPGPPNQELETILGRYPKGTKARIAKLLGDNPPKGALAELLRQALATELRKREKPSKG